MALLACLRGNIILFQGEELGLEQDHIPFELLQDPEAIANWPLTLSRDGVRTPMPWTAQDEFGGFTTGSPWLPLSEANLARAADRQAVDPEAMLAFTRRMIALRNANPALHHGPIVTCETQGDLLVLTREAGGQRVTCRFNLGIETIIEDGRAGRVLCSVNGADGPRLPPYAALITEE